ncbi:MAG: DUF131 domain-containing protein [Candidatus Aenigmarchaeota archaeon]|nr:DUF131 domain-containing protein [Candidatus Aenigmarchaeota archaeon]
MVETDLITLGVLVIIVGFVLAFIGTLSQTKGKAKVEGGGIIFIGPFPIIGGATSERAFYVLLAVSLVFMILFIILNYPR